jgi:hypothetical protein
VFRPGRPRVGRRGAVLAVLGVVDVLYGSAIVYARANAVDPRVSATGWWWPASQPYVLSLPTQFWGWVWIVVGVALLFGWVIPRITDRWAFALATCIKVCWACAASFNYLRADGSSPPGLWGVAVVWIGFAAIMFIVTGWSEVPRIEADNDD